MINRGSLALAAATSLLLAGSAGVNAKPEPGAKSKPVMRVASASVWVIRLPHTVRVCAKGLVNSGGWTNPQLVPVVYIQAPPNGIYDFTFTAIPPAGPATQPINVPIKAKKDWHPYPATLAGVRIRGATNSVVAHLNHGPSSC
jgi:hypothetical protein